MSDFKCHNTNKVALLQSALKEASMSEDLIYYKALANEIRLKIIHLLSVESCCVCDLAHSLELPVATVSQHLKILKTANLLSSSKRGKFIEYELSEEAIFTRNTK